MERKRDRVIGGSLPVVVGGRGWGGGNSDQLFK